MAEWLRRQIRNLVGSARGGSNPPAVARMIVCSYHRIIVSIVSHAWMAEWSKAADLSSVIFGCVGSNPTSGIRNYIFCCINNYNSCAEVA